VGVQAVGPAAIEEATAVLRGGGLVAFPTETVYGLGADATRPLAVARLYAVKGRPSGHPVIVHLPDAGTVEAWAAEFPESAARLAAAYWPGPLTLLLRRAPTVLDLVTGGRDTVGLRVPAHPVAQTLLRSFGGGVAAPSANRFGAVSPTTADHVRADLGAAVDVVLDGGPCPVGVESTIVDCSDDKPVVLRPGGVPIDQIEATLGHPVRVAAVEGKAPGTLRSHYSPAAQVVLVDADAVAPQAASLLAEGRRVGLLAPPTDAPVPAGLSVLDAPHDADEFARALYARLREADAQHLDVVLVVPPAAEGIGVAVRDRLQRASS
jgi:L-threonylcarbamoyladenylate synthase